MTKDTKVYKLIKDYPNHSIGDLAIYDNMIAELNFYWMNSTIVSTKVETIPQEFQPDVTPEWFELCLFVTEDGVPIFYEDNYYATMGYESVNVAYLTTNSSRDTYQNENNKCKYFSTKESAEKYLQNLKYEGIKFEKVLLSDRNIRDTVAMPNDYDNVEHIGFDRCYGDVFKCYQNGHTNFVLYFGIKS